MENVRAFIDSVILSDVLIYIVLIAVLTFTTLWSLLRLREFVGYVLGWFAAIFVIFVFQLTGASLDNLVGNAVAEGGFISLGDILIPSFIGFLLGFVLLWLLNALGDSRGTWAASIGVMTFSAVTTLYFMATSGIYTRKLIGVYALAFAIGALLNVVLRGIPQRRTVVRTASTYAEEARAGAPTPLPATREQQERITEVEHTEVRQN